MKKIIFIFNILALVCGLSFFVQPIKAHENGHSYAKFNNQNIVTLHADSNTTFVANKATNLAIEEETEREQNDKIDFGQKVPTTQHFANQFFNQGLQDQFSPRSTKVNKNIFLCVFRI